MAANYKISVYQEYMGNNGKILSIPELEHKALIAAIKNKYRKKPKRLFSEAGEELFPDNMAPLESHPVCIWTNGNGYEPTEKSKTVSREVQVTIIAEKTEVSPDAIYQLHNAANRLERVVLAFGMPDLHVGSPCPIGSAIISRGVIYPQLIGSDVGCGMSLFQTSAKAGTIDFRKFEGTSINIDGPWTNFNYDGMTLDDYADRAGIVNRDYNHLLGTIGAGNHFAEIQEIVSVPEPDLLAKAGISDDHYHILVHSGSRGYGYDILKEFSGKVLGSVPAIAEYMEQHLDALNWAKLNRALIAQRMNAEFLPRSNIEHKVSVYHNFVSTLPKEDADKYGLKHYPAPPFPYYIHRKGATPANKDNPFVLIPGSRGSYSYLVHPKQDQVHRSGFSLSHGAGRRISRGKARSMKNDRKNKTKPRKKDSLNHFVTNPLDNVVICNKPDLLYEEAPRAYKDIETVIDDLVSLNLVTIIAVFKPVLTYKCNASF
jgi:release factor H-coupled RctB family protein